MDRVISLTLVCQALWPDALIVAVHMSIQVIQTIELLVNTAQSLWLAL